MKRTQRDQVLDLLKERGEVGLSAREAIYEMGITRLAAIVFDLKRAGHNIATIDEGKAPDGRQRLARYVLKGRKTVGVCQCGHLGSAHVGGMRCLAPGEDFGDCPCRKYVARGTVALA